MPKYMNNIQNLVFHLILYFNLTNELENHALRKLRASIYGTLPLEVLTAFV